MPAIEIIREKINKDKLKRLAQEIFGDMVKVVVDIERRNNSLDRVFELVDLTIAHEQGPRQLELERMRGAYYNTPAIFGIFILDKFPVRICC
ncbi:hypothetical protein KKF64_01550 [Patescibacteria group bacterium]|nr:hypothetical protein [Patescibacteria group bacterium]